MSYYWCNNGKTELQLNSTETMPEGYVKGRIKTVYYNNGVTDIKVKITDTPPEGYVKGRLYKYICTEEDRANRKRIANQKTPEQKKRESEKAKKTKLERYGSESFNNIQKRRETCLNKYGDPNYSNRQLFLETINNKSDDEKELANQKRSNTLKIFHENLTPQEKVEWKKNHYGRVVSKETREKLSNAWTKDKIEQMLKAYSVTCLERYGVPYYCMTNHCKQSSTNESGPNNYFSKLLMQNGYSITRDNREFIIDNFSYDFKIGNNLIEINPTPTHNSTWSPFPNQEKDKDYHYNKSKVARDNGYRCICIWDWDDPYKIIELLKNKEKVFARKCIIKEVSINDSKSFINQYHLQGYVKSEINIGLYFNDELISIMTFGKPRYNKNYEYELIRYCSSKNVVGGAEKLFNYFIRTYNPKSIISYCDWSKFNGDVYLKLGFKYKSYSIGKHWYNIKTKKHVTDNLLRQRGFDQLLGKEYGCYGKGILNEQLMLEHNFVEIYDCGQAVYEWIIE